MVKRLPVLFVFIMDAVCKADIIALLGTACPAFIPLVKPIGGLDTFFQNCDAFESAICLFLRLVQVIICFRWIRFCFKLSSYKLE